VCNPRLPCGSNMVPAAARHPQDLPDAGVFAKGPSDVLDHATNSSKLGIDATKKIPGEGFNRSPPSVAAMTSRQRRAGLMKSPCG